MTKVFTVAIVFWVVVVHANADHASASALISKQKIVTGSGTSFSGAKECGDFCITKAIEIALRDARQQCASEVEEISQWSVFHGSDPAKGYGAKASAQFKCVVQHFALRISRPAEI